MLKIPTRSWRLWGVLLLGLLLAVDAAGRKKRKEVDGSEEDVPEVHYLVEMIGKELYSIIDRPKYRFYIYMTIGTLPEEHSMIALINVICNVLYGLFVICGFWFLPRGFMLFGTLATLYIGPALVLILLGSIGLAFAAFAFYPVTSVVVVWLFFFFTSHLAQTIGRQLGLDFDGDGDIDCLDILHVAASTNIGQMLRLPKLHEMLNESSRDPFIEIHRRLDEIQRSTQRIGDQPDAPPQQASQDPISSENGHNGTTKVLADASPRGVEESTGAILAAEDSF